MKRVVAAGLVWLGVAGMPSIEGEEGSECAPSGGLMFVCGHTLVHRRAVGLRAGDEVWLGSSNADRIAYRDWR